MCQSKNLAENMFIITLENTYIHINIQQLYIKHNLFCNCGWFVKSRRCSREQAGNMYMQKKTHVHDI